ncbi:MAG TPA: rhomboid family intramembrane serine protease [Thermoprotei archaeon]|nr:rhomboid family intramembrane serine protease [Thermoprotei archaeon]
MWPLGDENRSLTFPYVNYTIIAINVIVFLMFFLPGIDYLYYGILNYGVIPAYIFQGKRLWTLFTSMFIHAGPLHLFGNMLFLYIFGDNTEDAYGHAKYLIFYIFCGLGASALHLLTSLSSYSAMLVPAVGASGAISGVLGAYMVLYPRARIKVLAYTPFGLTFLYVSSLYFIGFWFLQQLFFGTFSLTGLSSGVAYWAHIGGFITGMLLTKMFRISPRRFRRPVRYRFYRRVYRVPVE